MKHIESARPVGEIAWVNILNPHERPGACGKWRPGVLVHLDQSGWRVMGLTSKRKYLGGVQRTPVPNPSYCGLDAPSFLWGGGLTRISASDVGDHIGFADLALADAIIGLTEMYGCWAEDLRNSVLAEDEAAK